MLHRHGVEAETIMQAGSPARMILRVAVDYDLLVVGGRSAEEPGRAGLGSVASRIVEHSPIPVLIARHLNVDNIEGGLRILAAVDNSQTALDGLDRLAECVDLTCADVTLLHVVETPWLPHLDSDDEWRGFDELRDEEDGGEYQGQTGPEAEIGREFERQGSYVIEQARDHLPPQAAVTTLIREGLPGAEILSAIQSGEYDLVVTGHSGSLDMKRRMLGSVAISVASYATCPVLVVGRAG